MTEHIYGPTKDYSQQIGRPLGFVSILGTRQSCQEEIERSCTCPTLGASHKEARVKKKKTTNGSRHGLFPEYDPVDIIGKCSKQA